MPWTTLTRAATLPGEIEPLAHAVADLTDRARLSAYADWLAERDDPRGAFLHEFLATLAKPDAELPGGDEHPAAWRNSCGVTVLSHLRTGGMEPLADRILPLVRPALVLRPVGEKIEPEFDDAGNLQGSSEDQSPIGASKFGGLPDLADGTDWPVAGGYSLTFHAQLRLADLAGTLAGRELPAEGTLAFFYLEDHEENVGIDQWDLRGRVLHNVDGVRRVRPTAPFTEENRVSRALPLVAAETLDLPWVWPEQDGPDHLGGRRAKAMGLTAEHSDAYDALLESLRPRNNETSCLLGWCQPQVLYDDPVGEDRRLLLTLASEELLEWCFGDGHQLFFSVPAADLPAGGFAGAVAADG